MFDNGIAGFFLVTLLFSMPYILGAMSGIFSERSGIANIGVEGLMISGAFATAAGITLFSNWVSPEMVIFVVIPVIILFGVLFSFILSVTTIKFRADQIIAGVALNSIAFALLLTVVYRMVGAEQLFYNNIFSNQNWFTIGSVTITTEYILAILGIIAVLVGNFVLFKTPFGLRVRASGENPSAAESMGINVNKIRYQAVAISGMYGALAGMFLSLTARGFDSVTVAGQGFLAIAILILARWKPVNAIIIGYIFGTITYMAIVAGGNLPFGPSAVYLTKLIPYVLTIIVLLLTVKMKDGAPKAVGSNYISEQ